MGISSTTSLSTGGKGKIGARVLKANLGNSGFLPLLQPPCANRSQRKLIGKVKGSFSLKCCRKGEKRRKLLQKQLLSLT
jgi:hypothetical protein